jgi:biotin carboxyl carrier protein
MNEFVNKVSGKTFNVKIVSSESVEIDNSLQNISITKQSGDVYLIHYKNRFFKCKLLNVNAHKLDIFLNNNRFTVECKSKLEVKAEEINSSKSQINTEKVEVFSPMPGLVLKILKNNGDVVKKGEPVLILEAMKMENEIISPADGVLGIEGLKEGQSIEKSFKLFEVNNLLFEKK